MNKKVTKTFSNKMHVWIHDSMKKNPSWEDNKSSASQAIPKFYRTWRFITTFTTASHLSLSWTRSIKSIPPPHFLKIHFNTIPPSTPRSSKWSPSPPKPCVHLSCIPFMPPGLPISFYLIYQLNNIWWGVQIIKFLLM